MGTISRENTKASESVAPDIFQKFSCEGPCENTAGKCPEKSVSRRVDGVSNTRQMQNLGEYKYLRMKKRHPIVEDSENHFL